MALENFGNYTIYNETTQYEIAFNDSMVTVTNNSTEANETDTSDEQTYMLVGEALSYVLFLLITSLNIVVLLMIKSRKTESNRLHFFILHLAIADLLVGAVTMLGDAIESSLGYMWYAGDVGCRIYRFFIVFNMLASNNLLVGMSIDRYCAVAIPMKYVRVGSKFSKFMVGSSWFIGVVLATFFLVFGKGENKWNGCEIDMPDSWWQPYLTTVAVFVYILPTIVIATCYIGICVVVWKAWKSGLTCPKLIVTEGFFVCWTPYFVYMLLDTYDAIPRNFGLTVLMGKLYPLNSVLNPLIFILFNMKMLRRVCSKKHDYLYIMTYTTTNGNCKMYRSSTSLTSFGKRTSRSGSTCSVSKVSVGSGVCSKIYIGSGVKRLSV